MRTNWLIAAACSASLAAPFAHAQEHSAGPAPQQTTAHRTISPIGKVMADLLRQAASHPSPTATSGVTANPSAPGNIAHDVGALPSTAATPARPSAEVAVQPPM